MLEPVFGVVDAQEVLADAIPHVAGNRGASNASLCPLTSSPSTKVAMTSAAVESNRSAYGLVRSSKTNRSAASPGSSLPVSRSMPSA